MTEKSKCGEISCGDRQTCEGCPAKWTPKNSECEDSKYINCDHYITCADCPISKPGVWPSKKNINIILGISERKKAIAFDSIVKRFIAAKDTTDMEIEIANILSLCIEKEQK
jgi:hypothetical protein